MWRLHFKNESYLKWRNSKFSFNEIASVRKIVENRMLVTFYRRFYKPNNRVRRSCKYTRIWNRLQN